MFIFSLFGLAIILIILWDAFETVVLPRRITRRFRLARIYYRFFWSVWVTKSRKKYVSGSREDYLAFFGPLSLILLLVFWAFGTQANFTFAMAKHAVIDLSQVFYQVPRKNIPDRLPSPDFKLLETVLKKHGIPLKTSKNTEKQLKELRASYEPQIQVLSEYFQMPIQSFIPGKYTKGTTD